MKKKYKVWKNGRMVENRVPGKYAGNTTYKIFGRLDCQSGMRMKRENRVFFLTLQDALDAGYRPCQKCQPLQREFNILTA